MFTRIDHVLLHVRTGVPVLSYADVANTETDGVTVVVPKAAADVVPVYAGEMIEGVEVGGLNGVNTLTPVTHDTLAL